MNVARPLASAAPAVLVALLPKCPACLGAYLAIASGAGLGITPGALWIALGVVLAISLALLARAALRRRRYVALGVAVAGAALVLGGRALDAGKPLLFAGVALLYAGALRVYFGRRRACHST